jgi:hypothetical protein
MSAYQILILIKHFRPDELVRFLQYYSRKSLKGLLEEIPQSNLDQHCLQNWFSFPTVILYEKDLRSV